jgi:hypothetical protein
MCTASVEKYENIQKSAKEEECNFSICSRKLLLSH